MFTSDGVAWTAVWGVCGVWEYGVCNGGAGILGSSR